MKRTPIKLLLVSIACMLAVAIGGSSTASCTTTVMVPADQAPDDPDLDGFYDPLSPYGEWWWSDTWGWVYSPHVVPGWRPYTVGHWVLTGDGWLWASGEPFGWACFHYGRWAWLDDAGWVWIPGRVWAPAWVSWRAGGGYYGWAPIGPPEVVVVPWFWIFVDEPSFLDDDVSRVVIVPARNATVLPTSRVIHRPAREEVEHATGHRIPIQRVVDDDRDAASQPDAIVVPRLRAIEPSAASPLQDRSSRDLPGLRGRLTPGGDVEKRPLATPDDDDVDRAYAEQRRRLIDDQSRRRASPGAPGAAAAPAARDGPELQQLDDDKAREKKALQNKRVVPRKVVKPRGKTPPPPPSQPPAGDR